MTEHEAQRIARLEERIRAHQAAMDEAPTEDERRACWLAFCDALKERWRPALERLSDE